MPISSLTVIALAAGAAMGDPTPKVILKPIALSGKPAWEDPGYVFRDFGEPRMAPGGAIAFTAIIEPDEGGEFVSAGYLWTQTSVAQVAREGAPLGDHRSLTYNGIGRIYLNDAGQVVIPASYTYDGTGSAILAGPAHDLRLIALAGSDPDPTPQPGYRRLEGNLFAGGLSDAGLISIEISHLGKQTAWAGPREQLLFMIASDQEVPEIDAVTGAPVSFLGFSDLGEALYIARVHGDFIGQSPCALFRAWPAIGLPSSYVLGPSDSLPGVEGPIRDISNISMARTGEVTFTAVTVDDKPPGFRRGIWTGPPDDVALLMMAGDPAPGFPGFRFGFPPKGPVRNASGAAAFVTRMYEDGGIVTEPCVFLAQGLTITALAVVGDTIANRPDLTLLAAMGPGASWLAISASSRVMFGGHVEVGNQQRNALFTVAFGQPMLALAIEGEPLEIGPGDVRIVDEIAVVSRGNGEDGRGSPMSDAGDIAFSLSFKDGSAGLFVATVDPTPDAPPQSDNNDTSRER